MRLYLLVSYFALENSLNSVGRAATGLTIISTAKFAEIPFGNIFVALPFKLQILNDSTRSAYYNAAFWWPELEVQCNGYFGVISRVRSVLRRYTRCRLFYTLVQQDMVFLMKILEHELESCARCEARNMIHVT